jgi:hypothetical protein
MAVDTNRNEEVKVNKSIDNDDEFKIFILENTKSRFSFMIPILQVNTESGRDAKSSEVLMLDNKTF